MRRRGQVIVVVAILLMIVLLLLALAVDVGRLFVERGRMERAAQAAADAGVAVVAEQIVTLAIPRQTEAAARPPCVPDAGYGTPGASCTATPLPSRAEHWLTDDDRATLVGPAVQTEASAEALAYAAINRADPGEAGVLGVEIEYPHAYRPQDAALQMMVSIDARLTMLLAGLLGVDQVAFEAQALSEIRQR
ncbi:MAG TPA: pilus assembly protein TadG-related protein [Anaerolineales bacterium]|nr:pilus assembly protein TadG-related protein [Anaerolineales bacterium]